MHIKNPTIIALTFGMLSLGANAAVTITKDVRSAATWDAFTVTTVPTSESSSTIDGRIQAASAEDLTTLATNKCR